MILAVHFVPAVDLQRFVYLGAAIRTPSGIDVGFSCMVKQEGVTVPKDAGFSQVECGRFGVMPRDALARFMNHNKSASTIAVHGFERFRKMIRAALDEMGRPDEFPRPMQSIIDTAELAKHLCRLAPEDDTADAYRVPTLAEATAALIGRTDRSPAGVAALAAHLTKLGMTEAA
jgi:hypothetical protein